MRALLVGLLYVSVPRIIDMAVVTPPVKNRLESAAYIIIYLLIHSLMDKNISAPRMSRQNETKFYIRNDYFGISKIRKSKENDHLFQRKVRSNSWDAQLAVPNDTRYARLVTNLWIGLAKDIKCGDSLVTPLLYEADHCLV
ncbi:hypothetical protein TNCV_3372661 [Trichonephila clavipes]|nr:hypothetical protein TNCV_3372661 [Trichonephila clavipes]